MFPAANPNLNFSNTNRKNKAIVVVEESDDEVVATPHSDRVLEDNVESSIIEDEKWDPIFYHHSFIISFIVMLFYLLVCFSGILELFPLSYDI